MKKVNPLIQWWMTPKLPLIHYSDKVGFVKKWFFHPLKRRLAKSYLFFLRKFTNIKVIAITGSAGKTTTKEMLAAILKQDGFTVYSPQNIDPIYNIPTTILKIFPGVKYLVLEMGVEYPGEMDFYLWMAQPDICVITNIFPTHIEFFGSIGGVFAEKRKLVDSLSSRKVAVLNSGDKKLKSLDGKLKAKTIWFAGDKNPFKQNENAARAVAEALNISQANIKEGLEVYQNPPHRLELIQHPSGALILDDTYNSNPWAALSTLEYFNSIAKGRKIAVLGDMLELGEYDEVGHRELGKAVATSGFSLVIGVGKSSKFLVNEVSKRSKQSETHLVSDWKAALKLLEKKLGKNTSVLVKGSRSIGLDRLVEKL